MKQILILGASGTVGGPLVKNLKAKGYSTIEATSQKTLKPGQVYLDLLNPVDLETIFDNIDRLFLLSPPGHTNQDVLLAPLIAMAKKKGLRKVVLMTAMGANGNDAAPMRKAEVALENSGIDYNIIRPNWFMQNFNSYWIQGINNDGKIYLPTGKAKGSFIDAQDIADVAAELLVSDKYKNQDFDLTGSDALDHFEVAKLISEASGRQIAYQDITAEEMHASLLKAGLPKDYTDFMILILGYFKEGYSERTTNAVETITGKKPKTFRQYTQENKSSWIK